MKAEKCPRCDKEPTFIDSRRSTLEELSCDCHVETATTRDRAIRNFNRWAQRERREGARK